MKKLSKKLVSTIAVLALVTSACICPIHATGGELHWAVEPRFNYQKVWYGTCQKGGLFLLAQVVPSIVQINIDGSLIQYTSSSGSPFIDANQRTQVPLRATMESIGAKVNWDQQRQTASVVLNYVKIDVPIGKAYIYVNGEQISNDTAATIKDGRTYLPIRVVLEALGYSVSWDAGTRTVVAKKSDKRYATDYLGRTFAEIEAEFGANHQPSYLGRNFLDHWVVFASINSITQDEQPSDIVSYISILGENWAVSPSLPICPTMSLKEASALVGKELEVKYDDMESSSYYAYIELGSYSIWLQLYKPSGQWLIDYIQIKE